MLIAGFEFPDECPDICNSSPEMGLNMLLNVCTRCPVYNCAIGTLLVAPEHYRPDWAAEFKRWFDSGCVGIPQLKVEVES